MRSPDPVRARWWFLGSLVAYLLVLAAAALLLPDRVPLHFDGSGAVDRVGSRTEALVVFGLVGALLGAVLGGAAAWSPRMPLTFINLPAASKEWWTATPEREGAMRRRMERDLWAIAAATVLLLCGVCLLTVRAARSVDPGLGPWFWVVLGLYLLYVLGWTLRVVRGHRPTG
ncbi:DUF1648 domain-containing protein [Nocardioides sp.]|uniref:DUF1648 domain-containing protein n=1 Tax=Nocardioides sp. TaxID=35761 RepID=UPI002B27628A|nr:DUF1648 domain-containing protein [Nocardioides sp.]